jgi:hypothetical protein
VDRVTGPVVQPLAVMEVGRVVEDLVGYWLL